MEIKFQYQEQLGQDLEYWLTPRGGQFNLSFFSEDYKQEKFWNQGYQ